MTDVLTACNVLKIVWDFVGFVAIFVIDLKSYWARPNKRVRNHLMDCCVFWLSANDAEANAKIEFSRFMGPWCKDSSALSSTPTRHRL